MFGHVGIAQIVQRDITTALFVTLRHLPLGLLMAIVATILIITFFVTSADSATFVLGMMSSNGDLNPTNKVKILWGVLQSAIAVILLLTGGLKGLQTASIVAALPFSLIMLAMCVSIYRAFNEEHRQKRHEIRERERMLTLLLRREEY